MKNIVLALAALAAAPLAASADVSKEDVKKLAAAGVGDEVILTFIRNNGPVAKLSADDVVELKQAGASERVLSALMAPGASAPAPQAAPAVERRAYSPSSTYVVDTTPTYYYNATYYPYYWPTFYYSGYCYPGYYYPRYSFSYSYCWPRSSWSNWYTRYPSSRFYVHR